VSADRVAGVARLVARDGLVEAFGHVSARNEEGFLITPTSPPLATVQPGDVLTVDSGGRVIGGDPARLPIEMPLHAAIYAARADVGAICRTHSPHAVAWAARSEVPPLRHGLGMLAGTIVTHSGSNLVATVAEGQAAADDLDEADCLLLRANGIVATGPDLMHAVVRAHYLEERAQVASAAPSARPLDEVEQHARGRHLAAETERAWSWLRFRYAD
jgi:HCOMODA/2-hydroxy-3-carboxy-muconic semialdehyde decarboxylase